MTTPWNESTSSTTTPATTTNSSDAEATGTEAVNYEIPPLPPGITVTVHLDDEQNELKKIRN